MPDLTVDLARIERHIVCLERASVDSAAPADARAVVAAMARAAVRMAADLAGQDRTDPDAFGLSRNDTERNGTEADHGDQPNDR